MRIKVCGLTKAEQVNQLNEMQIDFAGFNFYPRSPRYVFKSMPAAEIKKIKGNINKVGVFIDADYEEVIRTVDECGLYLVQLNGNESPKYCEKIADYVSVIKTFRLSENEDVLWKIKDYYEVADMFLFDTESSSKDGGSKFFNWQLLKGLNIRKPFFLSGGIRMEDAVQIKSFLEDPVAKDLFAIDIGKPFEILPGIFDISLVKNFALDLKS